VRYELLVDPLVAVVLMFWKPLLVGFLVLFALVTVVLLPGARMVARDRARDAAPVPTTYLAPTWRDSLTQAAR
jgi:hypothetical protein